MPVNTLPGQRQEGVFRCSFFGPAAGNSPPIHGWSIISTGSEIRVVEAPDLGTLVSVTILLTVGSGSTTFTVLLPRVNLPAPPALPALVPVATEGITTVHRFSVFPPLLHGQQEFYTVTPLQGTAG
jgi:hypothetical protein